MLLVFFRAPKPSVQPQDNKIEKIAPVKVRKRAYSDAQKPNKLLESMYSVNTVLSKQGKACYDDVLIGR